MRVHLFAPSDRVTTSKSHAETLNSVACLAKKVTKVFSPAAFPAVGEMVRTVLLKRMPILAYLKRLTFFPTTTKRSFSRQDHRSRLEPPPTSVTRAVAKGCLAALFARFFVFPAMRANVLLSKTLGAHHCRKISCPDACDVLFSPAHATVSTRIGISQLGLSLDRHSLLLYRHLARRTLLLPVLVASSSCCTFVRQARCQLLGYRVMSVLVVSLGSCSSMSVRTINRLRPIGGSDGRFGRFSFSFGQGRILVNK